MAVKRKRIPRYSKVQVNGYEYYKTDIEDAEGKRVILYGKTREELYEKELAALEKVDSATFRRTSPTVAEYCEKWLLMQSVHVRATTLTDYTSKVRRHIIKELGEKRMAEVTLDDIQVALVPVSKKSASVYKSVVILYKSIFRATKESHVIDTNPTIYLRAKGGGVPQEERQALTDEQAQRLLDAVRGLPPYVFVMIGLYAGLRREEILALQWDSVYLDTDAPYLTVRRAWHTEHNRPVILTELKTKAAERNIPLPDCLAECLKESGVQGFMSHKGFDRQEVSAVFIEMGTKRMPERMAGDPVFPAEGIFMCAHMAHDIKGINRAGRIRLFWKKPAGWAVISKPVFRKDVQCFLREDRITVRAVFGMCDMDVHIFPLDVTITQAADLADPEAGRIHEGDHGFRF